MELTHYFGEKEGFVVPFCVDYRKLNEVTCKDSFPLPRIDDSLDALGGNKYFSLIDIFLQVTGNSVSTRMIKTKLHSSLLMAFIISKLCPMAYVIRVPHLNASWN